MWSKVENYQKFFLKNIPDGRCSIPPFFNGKTHVLKFLLNILLFSENIAQILGFGVRIRVMVRVRVRIGVRVRIRVGVGVRVRVMYNLRAHLSAQITP